MNMLRKAKFWQRFSKYFLVVFSLFILSGLIFKNTPSEILKRGPQFAWAVDSVYDEDPDPYSISTSSFDEPTVNFVYEDPPLENIPSAQSNQWEPTQNYIYEDPPSEYIPPVSTWEPSNNSVYENIADEPISLEQWEPTINYIYEDPPLEDMPSNQWEPTVNFVYEDPPQDQWEPTVNYVYEDPAIDNSWEPTRNFVYEDQPSPVAAPAPVAESTPTYYPPQTFTSNEQQTVQPARQIDQPVQPTYYEAAECVGYNNVLVRVYGDGRPLVPVRLIESNSTACGYVRPQPVIAQAPVQQAPQGQTSQTQSTSSNASSSSSSSAQGGSSTVNITNNVTPQSQTTNPNSPVQELTVNCSASPSTARSGEVVTWQASGSGGVPFSDGQYRYDWTGGDAPLAGKTGQSVQVSYLTNSFITKTAEIRVTDSRGATAYSMCRVNIDPMSSSSPTPTPSPSSTTTTTTVAAAQPTCPPNTIEKSRSATQLVCEAQTAVTTTAAPTQVVTTTEQATAPVKVLTQADTASKELPKTGLPLAAWGLASLVPVGLRLRKRGIGVASSKVDNLTANSIWMEKQFKS